VNHWHLAAVKFLKIIMSKYFLNLQVREEMYYPKKKRLVTFTTLKLRYCSHRNTPNSEKSQCDKRKHLPQIKPVDD
jgi:hypothetical protein